MSENEVQAALALQKHLMALSMRFEHAVTVSRTRLEEAATIEAKHVTPLALLPDKSKAFLAPFNKIVEGEHVLTEDQINFNHYCDSLSRNAAMKQAGQAATTIREYDRPEAFPRFDKSRTELSGAICVPETGSKDLHEFMTCRISNTAFFMFLLIHEAPLRLTEGNIMSWDFEKYWGNHISIIGARRVSDDSNLFDLQIIHEGTQVDEDGMRSTYKVMEPFQDGTVQEDMSALYKNIIYVESMSIAKAICSLTHVGEEESMQRAVEIGINMAAFEDDSERLTSMRSSSMRSFRGVTAVATKKRKSSSGTAAGKSMKMIFRLSALLNPEFRKMLTVARNDETLDNIISVLGAGIAACMKVKGCQLNSWTEKLVLSTITLSLGFATELDKASCSAQAMKKAATDMIRLRHDNQNCFEMSNLSEAIEEILKVYDMVFDTRIAAAMKAHLNVISDTRRNDLVTNATPSTLLQQRWDAAIMYFFANFYQSAVIDEPNSLTAVLDRVKALDFTLTTDKMKSIWIPTPLAILATLTEKNAQGLTGKGNLTGRGNPSQKRDFNSMQQGSYLDDDGPGIITITPPLPFKANDPRGLCKSTFRLRMEDFNFRGKPVKCLNPHCTFAHSFNAFKACGITAKNAKAVFKDTFKPL